ncbi:MAG TPA: helix-turn-helix domain-containing protein [Smithella sp.]|mgnify:FL=1|jgi:plasmid maintenance system antidote protein VapI/Zn-dependent peptidase ImmA (M78 family)|nr:helix-turn-helix domain-containing protein [Smithella sp.]
MDKTKKYVFTPDYAVPPGKTLQEVIAAKGMSQKDLALRTGLTPVTLIRIFKGEQPITYETASRLELVTGVPARFWNNLELQYREQLARMAEKNRLEADMAWLKTIPIKELRERGYLKHPQNDTELFREALAFFGVSSVKTWHDVWDEPAVAARRSSCFQSSPGPTAAWIRQGEILASAVDCKPYHKDTFQEALKKIRSLTREQPEIFVPEMKRLCAESGVALSLVREMKKVPWNGATKWLSPQKTMILLSLRGKGEDIFWFSFFHEAGHVLHDSKKDLFINDGSNEDPREAKANVFAAEYLIPSRYDKIIKQCRSKEEIIRLSNELAISPGIVAGRFRHLTDKWNYFGELIRTFQWVS